MSPDDYEEDEAQKCPYCSSPDDCPHLLLVVDKTFRSAEGGVLMDTFNERWIDVCRHGGDDFDEREPFDSLLEEVDSLANAATEYVQEGGPGMSSAYAIYYAESRTKAAEALARFNNAGG